MSKQRVVRPRSEFNGIPVSPGIVIGRAYLVDRRKVRPPERYIDPETVDEEIARFHAALAKSKEQLLEVKKNYEKNNLGDYGYIVDVHLLMLDDQMIVRETERSVREDLHNADWALWKAIQKIKDIFSNLDDDYIKDRQTDIEHLGERILRNLVGLRLKKISEVRENVIIVAHDLSPMDTAQIDIKSVRGFVTDLGGRTSHTAILARALGIPAIVGMENITSVVNGGDLLVIDGISGKVIINPFEDEIEFFMRRRERYVAYQTELESFAALPAMTLDGEKVAVRANIELLEGLKDLPRFGAEGVGLYRTEFLYLNRQQLPTEEEHFQIYSRVAKTLSPQPLTIRTLDIGGDKLIGAVNLGEQVNPALGLRSIRLCLKEKEVFRQQLKGILRAGVNDNIKLMFPMVSGVWELKQALEILDECKAELRRQNVPFGETMPIGAMIEVPSAAIIADQIAKHVDFLSIGTNDLIQYALAIDRVNEHVAYLYEPLHPAVLKLIAMTADAGREAGIPVSVCGEMAGDELYTLVLLGLGIRELSMHSASIPTIKRVINRASIEESKTLAKTILSMSTASEVQNYIHDYLNSRYPGLLDPLYGE